jgi:DNA polymerase III alpha subunit
MFNKAHSAAYAVEAFSGAWLKTRYPIEFLAAVLSSRRGFYAPIVYVLEALRLGARFLPPDLHLSDPRRFTVRASEVRLPLDQVHGLSQATLGRILEHRPFRDPGDFFRRVQPSRPEWLALLKAGALDGFGEPRGSLFWRLQRLETFGAPGRRLLEPESPPPFEPSPENRARWEAEVLGFPVSLHPLSLWGAHVPWHNFLSAAELTRRQHHFYGKTVRVAGLVVADRRHPTPNGVMKFVTLADHSGFLEAALFPDVYRNYGHWTVQPVIALEAAVEPFDNRRGFTLRALRVIPLPARSHTHAL